MGILTIMPNAGNNRGNCRNNYNKMEVKYGKTL